MNQSARTFAERIDLLSAAHKAKGIYLKEISQETGISTGALSNYRNATCIANIDALVKLSSYFEVSCDWLLGVSNVRHHSPDKEKASKATGLSDTAIAFLADHEYEKIHENIINYENRLPKEKRLTATVDALIQHPEFAEFLKLIHKAFEAEKHIKHEAVYRNFSIRNMAPNHIRDMNGNEVQLVDKKRQYIPHHENQFDEDGIVRLHGSEMSEYCLFKAEELFHTIVTEIVHKNRR